MEGVAVDIGKTLVERLINKAIEKSRYIVCFTCISKEFDEEKEKLKGEMSDMRQRFKVATNKGKEIRKNAELWGKQANMLIQDDRKKEQRLFFEFFPDCIWRYKRGRDLTGKINEIKELITKGEKLENIELASNLPDVERYSSKDYISFQSREMQLKELLDALKDDNNYITGLHGMGGTGKTTLAIEVGKQLKRWEQFDHVVYTKVSVAPDTKKIQDDIVGSLSLEWGDINESDRPKKLWGRLTNGEKILVILDDVWGNLNFDDIGIPNSDNRKGCKVLVATRNLWVCNQMICGKTIQLELLSKEDAWVMFKMHANLSNHSSKSFHEKGYKITTECKRLPFAIATIASSLKGEKRLEEWDYALKSLKKHVPMGGADSDLVGIYKCLKFSYDYLKNENAKRLFLLCSVFPGDEDISIEILTRLSKGVDLFGEDYERYEYARSETVAAKNKLLDSCLLLETDEGEVKMHDLVREVAQSMAKKEIQTVNLYNKNQISLVERDKNIKYLLCEGNIRDFFSSRLDGSNLEILIFIMDMCDSVDVPVSFFENIRGLRVLYLSNKSSNWSSIELTTLSLPQSIQLLTNIRSLVVKNINLGDISILGSLKSLETLDLICCKIDELPRAITKLEKFQLLNLDKCKITRNNPFEVIQRCSSLEQLYFCSSFNDFCRKITLPLLQRYCITDEFDLMNNSLSKCVSLQQDYLSEESLKHVMQTAEVLKLERIENGGWRNLMPEIVPIDQGMNDLIELHLKYDSQLQRLVDTKHTDAQVSNVFSKLVTLELKEMKDLEELCNGPISFDNLEELSINSCENLRCLFRRSPNLCNLKSVTLSSCSKLISIFDLSTSRSMVLLEELEISDCEQLESILTPYDERKTDDKSCSSLFPKLKVVNIDYCPQLEFIFPLLSAKDLELLESVKIQSCDNLKYIFGQHQDVHLTSLKELQLNDLPNFIDIFGENSCHSKEGSSNSIFKPQTQLRPIKSNLFSWSHIVCCYGNKLRGTTSTKIPSLAFEDQPHNFSIPMVLNSNCFSRSISLIVCNIQVMELVGLSKMKSVFMLSTAPKMSLESLTIDSCDELEQIIVDIGDGNDRNIELDNVFPNLIELNVKDCPKLEYIFGHINGSDHNNVTQLHLPTLKCLWFSNLPNLKGMSTKNYHTTLPPLTEVVVNQCSQLDIKSIGDFSVPNSSMISTSKEITTIKELSGNMDHFLALEKVWIMYSNVQSIFSLNEANEKEMSLGLKDIELDNLPIMTCLFECPKNYFALKNLARIKIVQCEKLEIVFSTSIIRCLPLLYYLRIEECNELKYIFEDDTENKNMSNFVASKSCFPKLEMLVVVKCNKLKCVFPASICNELHELKALIIEEANELEGVFGHVIDQKYDIPNLKFAVFVNLPSLCYAHETQFQVVPNCFVKNCQNVSLTSALSTNVINYLEYVSDYEVKADLRKVFDQLQYTNSEKIEDVEADQAEVQATSEDMLTSSQFEGSTSEKTAATTLSTISETKIEPDIQLYAPKKEKLLNEQSMIQQCLMHQKHALGEIDTTLNKTSQCLKEKEDQSIQESSISETRNDPPIQLVADLKQQGIMLSVEDITKLVPNPNTITSPTHSKPNILQLEGSTTSENNVAANLSSSSETKNEQHGVEGGAKLTNAKKLTSSTHLELEQDVACRDSQETTTTTNNDQVSLNDDAFVKVSSIIVEQFPKDDLSPSNSLPFPFSFQTHSMPFQGNPSQKLEDLSSPSLVTWELEQLVSKKLLAIENLSLLTDFLVKHPSYVLRETLLSNRYKGYAYNCLAELLKFLQTHSVLDVLGSSRSEFDELLRDVRRCNFDKDWLDGVEKHALLPDLQFSQDALQKLLDSQQLVTKESEDISLKLNIFSQHVEVLKHQLTSTEAFLENIIQQKAQVLETKAALSAPLGY